MVQIISGFTEPTLHKRPPLLCNPSSPWRTPGSHGSRGKHVCKYSLLLHSHIHTCMNAPVHKHTKDKRKFTDIL